VRQQNKKNNINSINNINSDTAGIGKSIWGLDQRFFLALQRATSNEGQL